MTTLKELVDLGKELIAAEEAVATFTQRATTLRTKIIPSICEELELSFFGTDDGYMLEVVRDIKAAISKENRGKACAWLRENGHGDIVKNLVISEFMAGEEDEATRALELLTDNDIKAIREQNVHHSTLTALVKELLQEGKNVPMDILGVRDVPTTKVTLTAKKL